MSTLDDIVNSDRQPLLRFVAIRKDTHVSKYKQNVYDFGRSTMTCSMAPSPSVFSYRHFFLFTLFIL